MARVKRGKTHLKRRKNLLAKAKGYRWGRGRKIKLAKTAVTKAGVHSYRDRRKKKRNFRRLWSTKINAALEPHDLSYSVFIGKLKKANIELDRKILAELAEYHPSVFEAVIKEVS